MKKKTALFLVKWLAIFIVVSIVAFLIPRTIPSNPVVSLLDSLQLDPSEENVAKIEKAWGLDKPLFEQYTIWIGKFLSGDWGNSLITKQDIKLAFVSKLPYSLAIGLGGLLLSAVFAFFLGYGAAINNKGFCDKLSRALSLFSMSVPSFVLTVVIVYFFGVKYGVIKFFTGNGRWSLVIAILIMALYTAGPTARVVKTHFREQMTQPYITFAVSRGFSKRYVLFRHAYKPVLYGLLSVMISKLAYVLGGSAVLEFALGIPGISYFLVDSMHASDYYVLQSYLMVVVIWMFCVHLLFNVLLNRLDVRNAQ